MISVMPIARSPLLTLPIEVRPLFQRDIKIRGVTTAGNASRLKHRLQDLLMKTRSYLAISEDKCAELANTISSARNYFTHYDKSKTEPSFDCIAYSCEFLHFLLLILVYELLGISSGAISDCRNRVAYKNLDFFISKIK